MSANPVGWADTPAVRELREAAAECGLTIDPLAEREADWGLDEVDLLRLHRAWSAKMRARCGLSDTQPVTTVQVGARNRVQTPEVAERAYPKEGVRERLSADVRLTELAMVLPTEEALAISLGEINRRLKWAEGRDLRVLKRALLALAADGLAKQTDKWRRARDRQYENPRAYWYRPAVAA